MHEPLVEALPGILGAASAMGGLGGMAVAIAGSRLRRKKQDRQELEPPPADQPSDDDLAPVNTP